MISAAVRYALVGRGNLCHVEVFRVQQTINDLKSPDVDFIDAVAKFALFLQGLTHKRPTLLSCECKYVGVCSDVGLCQKTLLDGMSGNKMLDLSINTSATLTSRP